jgi:hypothetical protein
MISFTNHERVAIQAGVLKIHGNILHLREGGWTPFTRITNHGFAGGYTCSSRKARPAGSDARPTVTLKHGIIVLRHVISIIAKDRVLCRLEYPSSSSSSMRIGFSGDPSPNDVVEFPCSSLLPLSSSIVGRSKAGDRGRVEGNSTGMSS